MRLSEADSFFSSFEKRQQTLASAESCTGGLISSVLTSRPGASYWFLGGVCPYSVGSKVRVLGLSEQDISSNGVVSAETAWGLASSVRTLFGSDWGVGVTGYAGPSGGDSLHPVGTVYLAVCGPVSALTHEFFLQNREEFRWSTVKALFILFKKCLDRFDTLGL